MTNLPHPDSKDLNCPLRCAFFNDNGTSVTDYTNLILKSKSNTNQREDTGTTYSLGLISDNQSETERLPGGRIYRSFRVYRAWSSSDHDDSNSYSYGVCDLSWLQLREHAATLTGLETSAEFLLTSRRIINPVCLNCINYSNYSG